METTSIKFLISDNDDEEVYAIIDTNLDIV